MRKVSHDDHGIPAFETESTGHSDRMMVDEFMIQFIRKQLLRSLQVAAGQVSAFQRQTSSQQIKGPKALKRRQDQENYPFNANPGSRTIHKASARRATVWAKSAN